MTRGIHNLQREWEDLGELDPLWAILAHPDRQYGRWSHAEFMATGERHVEALMERAAALGLPLQRDSAHDFGCGIGRLTRPLASRFRVVTGIDFARPLVDQARQVNADLANCRFVHGSRAELAALEAASFDLVQAHLVLMHLPNRGEVERHIRELLRVLRPGGLLVFQIPARLSLRARLQPRRRAYAALRRLGVSSTRLYRSLGLNPMRTINLPESRVVEIVTAGGGIVVETDRRLLSGGSFDDRTYYVGRAPAPASVTVDN
jgi:SAM-dependent methyltransferase